MTLRKYWGADEGRGRNWLLGFESISPAKHKPEEMGSLRCAFTVVCSCCCCWGQRADTKTACLYMAPKCTLSALTEEDWGQHDLQLLIPQTERKQFVRLTKTQFTKKDTGRGQRQQKVKFYSICACTDSEECKERWTKECADKFCTNLTFTHQR